MINNYDEFNNEKVGNNEEAKLKKKRINDLKRQKLLVKIEQFFKQKEQMPNYTTNSDQGGKNYYDRY